MNPHQVWFTTYEVAEQMAIPEATIRRLCRAGTLPAVKIGKTWRVRVDYIEALSNQPALAS